MSGKNYFMIERRARLQKVVDLIKKHEGMSVQKVKGIFILQTGARGKTVDSYIRELIDAGVLEYDGAQLKAIV